METKVDITRLQKPMPDILYGQMTYNDKVKIGQFRLQLNKWSGKIEYHYYTPSGHRGKGGFTVTKAMALYAQDLLSTDPEMGKPENYVL